MKQLHNVVMLPTNEATLLYSVGKQLSLRKTPIEVIGNDYGNHHLYLTSSEEIKEGDWCIANSGDSYVNEIVQYKKSPCPPPFVSNLKILKKIVATTDKSLKWEDEDEMEGKMIGYLPQFPESFIQAYIKAYNEGKPITEVLVEYEEFFKGAIVEYRGKEYLMEDCNNYSRSYLPIEGNGQRLNSSRNELFIKNPKLKLRFDNTVIISPSKTYTREEVIIKVNQIVEKFGVWDDTTQKSLDKWIEQNL